MAESKMLIQSLPFSSVQEGNLYIFHEKSGDVSELLNLYKAFKNYFSHNLAEEVSEKYWTYWTWYSFCAWKVINLLPANEVADIVERHFIEAGRFNFDVVERLLSAMSNFALDPKIAEIYFFSLKKKIEDSDAPIISSKGIYQFSLGEVYRQVQIIYKKKDALRKAELKTHLHESVFSFSQKDEYPYCTAEKALNLFFSALNFFMANEPEDIPFYVDAASMPRRVYNSLNNKILNSIKSLIESRFPYDETGQFSNLEGVLAMLDTLADEQGDERIRDLYVFDETTGEFRWNEELLGAVDGE